MRGHDGDLHGWRVAAVAWEHALEGAIPPCQPRLRRAGLPKGPPRRRTWLRLRIASPPLPAPQTRRVGGVAWQQGERRQGEGRGQPGEGRGRQAEGQRRESVGEHAASERDAEKTWQLRACHPCHSVDFLHLC